VWYILELFQQCGIFWNCSGSVVYFRTVPVVWYIFRTVPAVWYILELFQQCGIFKNCSGSVVYFRTVPAVWYILELFQQCGVFCFSFYI
jgi:hypothetical protein